VIWAGTFPVTAEATEGHLKSLLSFEGETMSQNKKILFWSAAAVTSVLASAVALAVNRTIVASLNPEKSTSAASEALMTARKPLASASPQLAQSVGPVQMVRFTVYDEGIRPAVAHVSPGLVAIYLDDKSTHAPSLLLANDQHPLGAINRALGRSRGHSTILLTPGRYSIYEPNRRTNAATLVVAP